MDLDRFITQMTNTAQSIHHLVGSVSSEQTLWKPDPDTWSVLEVINHLYIIEREDFRTRLAHSFQLPDPKDSITALPDDLKDLSKITQGFLDEREHSLAWLRELAAPDWEAACEVGSGHQLKAGDMVSSWVAHDLLHLRQLVELFYAYTAHQAQPYELDYAGDW
jgi:hypothetical protein